MSRQQFCKSLFEVRVERYSLPPKLSRTQSPNCITRHQVADLWCPVADAKEYAVFLDSVRQRITQHRVLGPGGHIKAEHRASITTVRAQDYDPIVREAKIFFGLQHRKVTQSRQFDEVVKFDYQVEDEDSVEVQWAPISAIKPLSAFKQRLEHVAVSPKDAFHEADEEHEEVPPSPADENPIEIPEEEKRLATAPGLLETSTDDAAPDTTVSSDETIGGTDIPPVPEELVRYLLSADMNEERQAASRWKKVKVSTGFSSFWHYVNDDHTEEDPNDPRGHWHGVLSDATHSLKARLLRRYTSLFQGHDKLHLTDGGANGPSGPEVADEDTTEGGESSEVAGAAASAAAAAGESMQAADPYVNPAQMRFPRRPALHPSLVNAETIALSIAPANIVRDAEEEGAPRRYDISSRTPSQWQECDPHCMLRARRLWQAPKASERLSLAAAHYRHTSCPISIWVAGKPSSGKSAVARWLAGKLGLVR